MYHARVLGGLAVLALGIAVILFSRQLAYHSDYGPGPGFLPTWIGYVLTACAVAVTLQELRAPRTGERFFRPRTVVAVKLLLTIAVTFLVIPLLGFSISVGLFMLVAMRLLGPHRWIACGAGAVVAIVGVHTVFGRWLDIPLPGGLVGW